MDNNDSNIKPQQTGGLKLMTVFIAVLALHVVVIGGFTVYHLMSGGGTDADLANTDKNHKGLKSTDSSAMTDATSPDAAQADKTTTAPATGTDVASTPATVPATTPIPAPAPAASTSPVPDMATPAVTTTTPAPAPTPAVAPTPAATKPKVPTLAPPPEVADLSPITPSGPITRDLAPPAPAVSAPVTPTAPLVSGPVHMPPASATSATPKIEHGQTYTVKITDSYKKIAKAHHVTVAELKEANHIKGDVLHTGQKLIIPSGKTAVAESTPAPASTPTTAVNTSLTKSDLSEPASTSVASLAESPHSHTYTVMKGDTLIKIAHKFKTTPGAIIAENSISDPAKLTIGKKLKIPSKETKETRSAKNIVAPPTPQPSQVQAKESAPADNTPSGELANFVP